MPEPAEPIDRSDTDPINPPGWYRIRRGVRFPSFLITGAVLGFLVGLVVSAVGPSSARASDASALAFLGVVGAMLGALIAGVVAVLLDRRG